MTTVTATDCVSCGAPADLDRLDERSVQLLQSEQTHVRALLDDRDGTLVTLGRQRRDLEQARQHGDESAASVASRRIENIEARLVEIDRLLEGRTAAPATDGTCDECGAPLANGYADIAALRGRRQAQVGKERRLADLEDELRGANGRHRGMVKLAGLAETRGERALAVTYQDAAENTLRRMGDIERAIVHARAELDALGAPPAARAERRVTLPGRKRAAAS